MVITENISLRTQGKTEILDITDQVAFKVSNSGVKNGIATVFIAGSTAGITTIEFESGLVADFEALWKRIAPDNIPYEHNERWGDGNGYAHIRASLLGPSLTIPIINGKLSLGTWQQVIVVDFDNRPRHRQVIIQMMGE
jgi:secondary thiamine-phosphate synthase enzyme